MLRARGREETLILGSDTLRPLIRELLPEAEIVRRPRFSTLRYAGACKLARLPPRSAIVAFSGEQVYALAEMLRRFKGGAAVVMGSLSPATRNAQVAMFQRGEVDYLVATDAIGMGLNMDVTHVAFAGLNKFDGRRERRLTISEMAQIAGRAGRHQRDGSFGTLALGGERAPEFSEEEIAAIEEHRFRPLDHLYWRSADLDFSSTSDLIASLETPSDDPLLRSAPLAIDPFDHNNVYYGCNVIFHTNNAGQSWKTISPDLTRADPKTLGDSGGPSFGAMAKDAINSVVEAGRKSDTQARTLAAGKANIVDVVTALVQLGLFDHGSPAKAPMPAPNPH